MIVRKITGEGLVNSSGHLWKKQRRALTPGFHFGTLRETVPTIVDESRAFVNKISELNGSPIEAKKTFVSVTLRVIIATAFGGQFDSDWMAKRWNTIFHYFKYFVGAGIMLGPLADYLPLASRPIIALDEISKKAKEFIAKRREIPAENQTKADVVGLLLHNEETDDNLIIDEGM